MFINITMELGGSRRDIRIDSEQKVKEGLNVLRQRGKLPMGPEPDYFQSKLNQKPISAHKTFKEEKIYDGDILTAIL